LIYETNMRASMEAARWDALNDSDVAEACPYVRFRHRSIMNARDEHKAWDGMVLRRDDPWFLGASAPRTSRRRFARTGSRIATAQHGWSRWKPGEKNPSRPTQLAQVLAHRIGRLDATPEAIARANVGELVAADVFVREFKTTGKRPDNRYGEFPVAVLSPDDAKVLGAQSNVVLISHETLVTHIAKHPDITLADYRKIQKLLDAKHSEVWKTVSGERLIYIAEDGVRYRAVLKRTGDGRKNYFLSLYRDSDRPPKGAVRVR